MSTIFDKNELERQEADNAGEPKAAEELHHPLSPDDILLGKLDGKALKSAIEGVRKADTIKWAGPNAKEIWDSFLIMERDRDCMDHYEKYCKGVLPSEMSVQQIQTTLTFVENGEYFVDGVLAKYVEDKTLLKLLLRLDDLLIRYYEKHNLPVGARYNAKSSSEDRDV
jgi:hypothetical protein